MTDQIDSQIDKVNNLSLTIGGGLTKADTPYQLNIWAGQFFAFELTDDQATAWASGTRASTSRPERSTWTGESHPPW